MCSTAPQLRKLTKRYTYTLPQRGNCFKEGLYKSLITFAKQRKTHHLIWKHNKSTHKTQVFHTSLITSEKISCKKQTLERTTFFWILQAIFPARSQNLQHFSRIQRLNCWYTPARLVFLTQDSGCANITVNKTNNTKPGDRTKW